MLVYPDLKQDQLFSMIREIKKQNNNTLKNLSLNQILDKGSELKGNYFFTFTYQEVAVIISKGKIEKFEYRG